jgi:hypothetical protein
MYLVPLLLTVKMSKGDVLFGIGEIVEEMYMVNMGVLSLDLGHLYLNLEVAQIGENYHFGDILMYTNTQSCFDLKVKSRHCELCIVKKKDFSLLKLKFPEIMIEKMKQSCITYKNILTKRKMYIQVISDYGENLNKKEMNKIIKRKLRMLVFYYYRIEFRGEK